jgi:aryl-alcohol dehydrogenase-like predicted oxidoreductase
MTFGLQTEEAGAHAILDKAAEGGVNFIDTANVYLLGGGPSKARCWKLEPNFSAMK